MGGGRGPEAATGGHVGGPRRCRQPPLACDLGAGGSPWRGVGLWGVRPGGLETFGARTRGAWGCGLGRPVCGCLRDLGAAPPPRLLGLVVTSPLSSDAGRFPPARPPCGLPPSSGIPPPVVCAALHSFWPHPGRPGPLRSGDRGGRWGVPAGPARGRGGFVGSGCLLAELAARRAAVPAVRPRKAAEGLSFLPRLQSGNEVTGFLRVLWIKAACSVPKIRPFAPSLKAGQNFTVLNVMALLTLISEARKVKFRTELRIPCQKKKTGSPPAVPSG